MFAAYPGRVTLVILGLAVAGCLEGLTAAAFLPLFSNLTGTDVSGGFISKVMNHISHFIGMPLTLPVLLAMIVVIMSVRAVIMLSVYTLAFKSSAHIIADLRQQYLRASIRAGWLHFVSQKSGAAANTIGTEAMRAGLAFRAACMFLASIIQVAVYGALALAISWQVTLAAAVGGGIIVLALGSLVRMGRRAGHHQTELYNNVLSRLTDALYGFKPIKAMNMGTQLERILRRDVVDLQSSQFKTDFSDQALRSASELIIVILMSAGIFGLSAYAKMSAPTLLFMGFLFMRLAMRLSSTQNYYHNMVSTDSALWSVLDKTKAIQKAAEVERSGDALPVEITRDIKFESVVFRYGENEILKDFSLDIPAHKFTVLYGPSGSGKTTVIDLLCGLLMPEIGKILVDGIDLSRFSLAAWRDSIGYVPQDITLFHDTIFSNLTLGDASITVEQAQEALRLAGAISFVNEMEEGIDTMAGERGARLSGGQRQRISLARALLRKPKLLILDEATSALDRATEQSLLTTVKALSAHTTVVMVTHSHAARAFADVFYEIDQIKSAGDSVVSLSAV